MKVKMIKIIFCTVLGMFALTSCGRDSAPSEKQLKQDFTEKIFTNAKLNNM